MSSLRQNLEVFICFIFSISISGDSASYFIKTIMLMSLECTVAQTRMGFGRVTLPNKGCLSYAKIPSFIGFLLEFLETPRLFPLK